MTPALAVRLTAIFNRLHEHFGERHWWPAETPFEVAIGAVLTQNTAWRNVELAIGNLRNANALTPVTIAGLPRAELEQLIRPAGFFRQKAERLQLFAACLCAEYGGRIETLLNGDLAAVRARLLAFKGIGPETADSILLYAGDRLSFVVDAYTLRLFTRLGVLRGAERYAAIRDLFMDNLPGDLNLYNAYHALIVEQCKQFCRKRRPLCPCCPLRACCPRCGLPQ